MVYLEEMLTRLKKCLNITKLKIWEIGNQDALYQYCHVAFYNCPVRSVSCGIIFGDIVFLYQVDPSMEPCFQQPKS